MPPAPTRVITVEREYGSRGGEFAHELAARLGWRLLDSELPCAAARAAGTVAGQLEPLLQGQERGFAGAPAAARAAGVSAELAAKYDERLDPWYYRYGKVFWHDSVYSMPGLSDDQVFDSERMLSLIRQEILNAAKEGNCVLVGRGAACALAGQPGCFHIFVYATAVAKRDWFIRAFPKQAQNADQLLAAFDKRRAAVIRKSYQQEWCARSLYHLLLNSAIGSHAMIAATQGAAGLTITPEPIAR